MQNKFEIVNRELNRRIQSVLREWLPNGEVIRDEYKIGDLSGKAGKSLGISLKEGKKGKWFDFESPDNKGGDLISLYAKMNGINPGDAADELAKRYSIKIKEEKDEGDGYEFLTRKVKHTEGLPKEELLKLSIFNISAPQKTPPPKFPGSYVDYYAYKFSEDTVAFYVVKYSIQGKKIFCIYSYWTNLNWEGSWKKANYPKDRPLYGLEYLKSGDNGSIKRPVIIVEGEKTANSARAFLGEKYSVVSWCGGSSAVGKSNWGVLYDREVIIWPDADEAGATAADHIIEELFDVTSDIKIINVDDKSFEKTKIKGWDAADAKFKNVEEFEEWAKGRITKIRAEANETRKSTKSKFLSWEELGVKTNKKGVPVCNMLTAFNIMKNHPDYKDKLKMNEVTGEVTIDMVPLEENGIRDIQRVMQDDLSLDKMTSESTIYAGVSNYASKNKYNPIKEMYEEVKWDGVDRLHDVAYKYLSVDDNCDERAKEVYQAIFKNIFIAMAARIYRPGCKVDNMLILHGEQGIGKSRWVQILGGDYYAQLPKLDGKDALLVMRRNHILEAGEMSSFKKSDQETMKNFLSTAIDEYRVPYGKLPITVKRSSLVIGTTNEKQILDDVTGNRRYWVVPVGGKGPIHLKSFKRDLPQLRAEARHRFMAGETWHEMPDHIKEMQDNYNKEVEFAYQIHEFLCRKRFEYERALKEGKEMKGFIVFDHIAYYAIGIPLERITRPVSTKVGKALTSLGIETKRKKVRGKLYSAVEYHQDAIPAVNPDAIEMKVELKTGPNGGVLLNFPHQGGPPDTLF